MKNEIYIRCPQCRKFFIKNLDDISFDDFIRKDQGWDNLHNVYCPKCNFLFVVEYSNKEHICRIQNKLKEVKNEY